MAPSFLMYMNNPGVNTHVHYRIDTLRRILEPKVPDPSSTPSIPSNFAFFTSVLIPPPIGHCCGPFHLISCITGTRDTSGCTYEDLGQQSEPDWWRG
jgi:hypothetical protein